MLSSYPSIFNLGHRALVHLFDNDVIIEEKIDGCVSLDTPILTKDLRYIPAGFLKEGDELIGFDDTLNNPRLVSCKVTAAVPVKKPCVDIETDEGPVTASEDHPFLIRQTTNNNGKVWIRAIELTPGMEIVSLGRWGQENSWDAGYIAGMFDGEGSLVRSGKAGRILSFYQKTGPELELVEALLRCRGFHFHVDVRKRREDWSSVGSLIFRASGINKGLVQILRFLGTFRPQRLLSMSEKIWEGARLNSVGGAVVKSVAKSRRRLVMGLATDSGTYIANGLFSHNSQISFGLGNDGELYARSKGAPLSFEAPDKMFAKAIEFIKSISPNLPRGYTFRGEYLAKPKHNVLVYDRAPNNNIIIFDIENQGSQNFLDWQSKHDIAASYGMETVPVLFVGRVEDPKTLRDLLQIQSILGGQKVEGVVIKPLHYDLFGLDKKVVMGKFVSEEFKEVHSAEWKTEHGAKSSRDIIERLSAELATPARWQKAVVHLREVGRIEDSPRDIGGLIVAVKEDIRKECSDLIVEELFKWAWPQLQRACVRGLPEWYKDHLLLCQFEKEEPLLLPKTCQTTADLMGGG